MSPSSRFIRPLVLAVAAVAALALFATACADENGNAGAPTAAEEAAAVSAERDVYVPRNDVEGDNYNRRLEIADDPTSIMWCTVSFSNPSSPLLTVPIVGKLTSGNKRPYSTEQILIDTNTPGRWYSPEVADPQGFFGSSSPYRYGFTPAGFLFELELETVCTNEPLVWQREQTTIAMQVDEDLLTAQNAARDLLRTGDEAGAYDVLEEALGDE